MPTVTTGAGAGPVQEATDATLQASRALLGIIARSVATALDDVSLPQLRVLVLLSQEGPLRSGVVAERMGVHPSTFTRNADRLVHGGWVRRTEADDSRQAVLIELTDSGRAIVEHVTQQRRTDLAEILARVPAGRRDALVEAMRDFALAAGEPDPRDLHTLAL